MAFKKKPTTAEKNAANKLQSFKPQSAIGKAIAKRKNPTLPAVLSFSDLNDQRKALRVYETEANWQPSENFVGVPFWVTDAFHFESEYGSKIALVFKLDPKEEDTVHISLPWNDERDLLVKSVKKLRKTHKGVAIGALTIQLIETDMHPYKKIVEYIEGEDYGQHLIEALTTKPAKKAVKKTAKKTTKKPAKTLADDDVMI